MEQNVIQSHSSTKSEKILSRTMRSVIESAIASLPEEDAFNENKILFQISEYFVDRFPGGKLEYQLERMGMETTTKIKNAIQLYMTRYANTK